MREQETHESRDGGSNGDSGDGLEASLAELLRHDDPACPEPGALLEWLDDGADAAHPVGRHVVHCRRCQAERWLLEEDDAAPERSAAVTRVAARARATVDSSSTGTRNETTHDAGTEAAERPSLPFGSRSAARRTDRAATSRPLWALAAAVRVALLLVPFLLRVTDPSSPRVDETAPPLAAPQTSDATRGAALEPFVAERDEAGVPTLVRWATEGSGETAPAFVVEVERLDGAAVGSFEVAGFGSGEWRLPPEVRELLGNARLRLRVRSADAAGPWIDLERLR